MGVTVTLSGTIATAYTGGTSRSLITGCTGFGEMRKAVDNRHNSMPGNWLAKLYSCIAEAKPFRITVVTDTNSAQYITDIPAAVGWSQITWPPEALYVTGGSLIHQGAITDVEFGAADIEGRVEGSFTFTPTGRPSVLAGTYS
jgi:hypothetical protein